MTVSRRVLVVGSYLADGRETRIEHIHAELARSRDWEVEQRWTAVGGPAPASVAAATAEVSNVMEPVRFARANRLLAMSRLADYAYVLLCDDDIWLPSGFVDGYLARVERYDLAFAQPARTFTSITDHKFVTALQGVEARQTRFVEAGPLFSMRHDAVPLLTPFPEELLMGWGIDFVWPVWIERAGLRMGIVDAVPVAHDMRKVGSTYRAEQARRQMVEYLARTPHLDPEDAFRIVNSFSERP